MLKPNDTKYISPKRLEILVKLFKENDKVTNEMVKKAIWGNAAVNPNYPAQLVSLFKKKLQRGYKIECHREWYWTLETKSNK